MDQQRVRYHVFASGPGLPERSIAEHAGFVGAAVTARLAAPQQPGVLMTVRRVTDGRVGTVDAQYEQRADGLLYRWVR